MPRRRGRNPRQPAGKVMPAARCTDNQPHVHLDGQLMAAARSSPPRLGRRAPSNSAHWREQVPEGGGRGQLGEHPKPGPVSPGWGGQSSTRRAPPGLLVSAHPPGRHAPNPRASASSGGADWLRRRAGSSPRWPGPGRFRDPQSALRLALIAGKLYAGTGTSRRARGASISAGGRQPRGRPPAPGSSSAAAWAPSGRGRAGPARGRTSRSAARRPPAAPGWPAPASLAAYRRVILRRRSQARRAASRRRRGGLASDSSWPVSRSAAPAVVRAGSAPACWRTKHVADNR
jgi:hypothetical protein